METVKSALGPNDLKRQKEQGTPLSVITAYDYPFAKMAEAAQIDMLLVGDSLANVVLGHSSTRDIGMTEMLIACGAVVRGAPNTHVIADMPWQSDINPELALENARRFIAAGANSVKVEGDKFDVISALRQNGIEVVGHLGLTPQTAKSFKQVGKLPQEVEQILSDAQQLQKIGICALVIEHVPDSLGKTLSEALAIPVIGIGAGEDTDAQVLVMHDVLGLFEGKVPAVARKLADGYGFLQEGLQDFVHQVKERTLLSS